MNIKNNIVNHNVCFIFAEGCSNGCGNHGNCVLANNMYGCICNDGWEGESCSVRLEMECSDEVDNDQGTYLCIVNTFYAYIIIRKTNTIVRYCN